MALGRGPWWAPPFPSRRAAMVSFVLLLVFRYQSDYPIPHLATNQPMFTTTYQNSLSFPRLAVIGCGAIATYGHLPALCRLGWRPHVLIDPRIDFAERLAGRWKVARVAEDVSHVIDEIDAAVVAVPPRLHASVSLPLLKAGIHVLVEKPFATNVADARMMVETAAATGACLAVGHQRRFLFVNRWVKAAIGDGVFGDIKHVVVGDGSNFHLWSKNAGFEGTAWNAPSYWNANLTACGGGVLMDRGPHVFDTLIWWLGPVSTVDYSDDSLGGIEADVRIDLQFECGTSALVEMSRVRTLRKTALIQGSRGRIEVSLHRNEVLSVEPESLRRSKFDVWRGTAYLDEKMWGVGGPGERQLDDWLSAIRNRRPPFAPGDSALPVVELIERCYANRKQNATAWRTLTPRKTAPLHQEVLGLQGKTVLVTGGTGFIGGWLVERLVREGVRVRAAIRHFRNMARLARFSPEMVEPRLFEMGAPNIDAVVDDLVVGCAAVFHLAIDHESHRANVEAVRLLGAACIRHGARLVFTSSFTVYKPFPKGPLRESNPCCSDNASRLNVNLACQRDVLRMVRQDGLDAAILQPTIVYGPFASSWTERQVDALLRGPLVLPERGDGICNAVYVGDVVDALIAAAVLAEAAGETFLISGGEYPTWYEFYRHYARAVGRDNGVCLSSTETIAPLMRERILSWLKGGVWRRPRLRRVLAPIKRLSLNHLQRLRHLIRWLTWRRDGSIESLLVNTDSKHQQILPNARDIDEFSSMCYVRTDKAQRILRYKPAFNLVRGMQLTTDYIHWAHGHRRLLNRSSGRTT